MEERNTARVTRIKPPVLCFKPFLDFMQVSVVLIDLLTCVLLAVSVSEDVSLLEPKLIKDESLTLKDVVIFS